jgi:hypothetical protein
MKIREGFVSNSSSSSFVVFGKSIYLKDITSKLLKEKRIYAQSYDSCCDGIDFFLINQKMFDMFMEYGGQLSFFDVDAMFCEGGTISKDDIKANTIEFFPIEISYHSVGEDDLQEFAERYLDLPPAEDPEFLKEQARKIEEMQEQMEKEGLEAYKDTDGKTKLRKKDES